MHRPALALIALASTLLAGCPDTRSGTDMGPDMGARSDMGGMCTTAVMEDTVALCSDGCDNDGNTYSDCDDSHCCSVRSDCGAATFCGSHADGGVPPVCTTPTATEGTTAACTNGCDDDNNGYADCDDRQCCHVMGVTCGPTTFCGRPRDAGPIVACDSSATRENTIATCSDMCDEDADGFVDCADFNCAGIGTCPPLDGGMMITCAGPIVPEVTDATCSDGCSNDGDSFVDCADLDCMGHASCPFMCDGGTLENTLALCSDGTSNDCDTFVDCEDADCCAVRTDCAAGTFCATHAPDAG